tara:strand:- start:60 stop:374 length:315 start_codon:yes stop_codon:yes gene_type:complete
MVWLLNPILLKRTSDSLLTLIVKSPFSSDIVQFVFSDFELISSMITYEIGSPEISFIVPEKVCPRRLVRSIARVIYMIFVSYFPPKLLFFIFTNKVSWLIPKTV